MSGDYRPWLKESAFENEDKALHEIDELTKRWHERIAINNLALAERYFKNEMGIGLIFRKKKGDSKKFIAFFKRELRSQCLYPFGELSTFRMGELNAGEIGANRNNGPVFINNVQSIEAPEGFPLTSTVRLQSADDFFDFQSDPLEKSGGSTIGFRKVSLAPVYWEICFLQDGFAGKALADNQGSSQSVECPHQIVNDIPNKSAPDNGDWLFNMKAVDFDSWLRIIIHDNFVRISFLKGRDFLIEVVKVLYGPVDFYPTAQ
jgi:hypothetical protein